MLSAYALLYRPYLESYEDRILFNLNLKRGESHDQRKKVIVGYEQYDCCLALVPQPKQ